MVVRSIRGPGETRGRGMNCNLQVLDTCVHWRTKDACASCSCSIRRPPLVGQPLLGLCHAATAAAVVMVHPPNAVTCDLLLFVKVHGEKHRSGTGTSRFERE